MGRDETSRWVHFLYEPLAIRRFLPVHRKSTAALSTFAVEVSAITASNRREPHRTGVEVIPSGGYSCALEHFAAADVPLMVEYARATALADRAALELDKSGPVTEDGNCGDQLRCYRNPE
jgi:hypothetical protein